MWIEASLVSTVRMSSILRHLLCTWAPEGCASLSPATLCSWPARRRDASVTEAQCLLPLQPACMAHKWPQTTPHMCPNLHFGPEFGSNGEGANADGGSTVALEFFFTNIHAVHPILCPGLWSVAKAQGPCVLQHLRQAVVVCCLSHSRGWESRLLRSPLRRWRQQVC